MTGSLAVMLALAAAGPAPIRVAAPGVSGVNVTPELQVFVNDHLAQELVHEGLEVTTSAQVAAVLGLERQKQLLGCADTGCVVELANALGVDAILQGTVARLGTVTQLDVRLVSAADATAMAIFSIRVENEAGLLDAMTAAARALAPEVARKLGRPLSPKRPRAEGVAGARRNTLARNIGLWTMVGGGAVALGSFIGLLAVVNPMAPDGAPLTPLEQGFVAGLLGGAAAAIVGLVVFLAGGTEPVPVSAGLVPLNGGGVLTLGLRWP